MMRPYLRRSLRRAARAATVAAAILILSSAAFAAAGSGTATLTPSLGVPAGSAGTWTIRYTAADTFTTGTIQIVIPDGWTAPQAASPSSAGYVTASSMGTLDAPALTVAGRVITVHVAALDTSETVDVVYGDPSIDVLGRAVAQTAAQVGVQFAVSSDPSGASPSALAASPELNVVAGPVAKLVFITPPRTFTADGESAVILVKTEDEFGNPANVPGPQNVDLSSSAGSGRFSHLGGTNFVETGTVTMSAGEDTVSLHYRDSAVGGKTITASPVGQSWTDAQQSITVQAGTPFRLRAFPADTTVTAGDFVRYRLTIEDEEGNPSPPASTQTITLLGQPGSFYTTSNHGAAITQIGIASGTSTVYLDYRNTIKAVTIPDVLAFLDQDGVLPTLEAASATVFVENAPFDPGTSEISAGKPSAVANAVDSIEVTVHVKDLYGNGVDGATVVLASSGSSNFFRQPVGTTGESGTAIGSIKSTKAEGKALTAKVDGVDVTASAGVTFTAGPFDPVQSDVSINPSAVVANGVDTTVVTVTVRDAQGNPISGSAVTIGSTGGPNTIRQPSGSTGANGIAVGSVRSTKAEVKQIGATVGGVAITPPASASFVAGAFSPSVSTVAINPSAVVANGVDTTVVTVTVRDAQGNPISGSAVTIGSTGGPNTIRQPSGSTGANGIAVGSVRSTKAEVKQIGATVGGVAITPPASASFVAGPFNAGASDVQVDKTAAVADGTDSITVTVLATDAFGNPISLSIVAVDATGTLNTITPPSGLSGPDGRMVSKIRSTKAEVKQIGATVGGVAITNMRNVTFTAGAFSPSVSTVAINPSAVVANGVDTTVVTVTVRDAQGNPISGSAVTIGSTGGPNTIRQPSGSTGANGIAVGSVRSTKAEVKQIGATVGGVAITPPASASFVAGPFNAGASDVQVDKTAAVADGTDPITVTVYVLDAQGNGIVGKTVNIAATGSGNIYSQPIGQTDANGRAIASVRSTVAEGKSITAKADGADISKNVPVTFGAGTLHHFNVTHGGTATAGAASFVTLDARDSQNNKITSFSGIAKVYTSSTIPGDYVTWGLGNAAGSILSEVGDTVRYQFVPADLGDAELSITDTKVESILIYAASGAVISSSAAPLVVGHAGPDRMLLVSGDNQRAVVNQEVASALIVRVEDAFANPVPGVTVSWVVTKGGGYFDASRSTPGQQVTSVTGADGTTGGELWRLGTVSGLDSDGITASMPSGSTRSVAFSATTDFGPISSIVLAPGSKSVTVNSATIVTATLRDAFANPVANEYVTVFIKDAPDGHLSRAAGSTTDSLSALMRRGRSDSTGTVLVTYNAPAAAGLQDVLDAYSNTIPADNVADVTYSSVASGATDLRATVLTGQTSQAGAAFSFIVEAVDGNGNRDLTNASRIVLDPAGGAGFTFSLTNFGATITEADLASGAVTLYGRGTNPGSWRTNVNDKASVLLGSHFDVTVVPNDTVSSYLVVAPANATVGSDFSVLGVARDRFGNTATSANYQVNFRAVQAADSTQAASGTLSVPNGSLVNGLFTGTNFHYNVAEQVRVEVTSAANAVKGYSGVVAVGHGAAYRLVKLAGDSTGVSVGDSLRLRARVIDIYGNAVNGENVFFTVQQGGGHLSAPQAVTDAGGAVSIWFRTGTLRGTNVARASILNGDPPELETQSFTVTTVPKSTIARVVLAIPGGTSYHAGEVFAGNVAAFDQYDNLIDTDSSSRLRCVARHSSVSFVPSVMTLTAGAASFSASDTLAGVNRIRVLSLAGDSLSDWSGPITILPASAYRIVKVRGDTLGIQVGAKAGLKARVSDRYGNAVSTEVVRFIITSNLGGSPSLWDGTGAPGDGIVQSDAMGAAVCSLTTDAHAGLNTVSSSILDASPPALERVEFSVGTTAGTIARFDVLPDGFSKRAAQSFSLQLIAYDLNGNVAVADDTSRVFLGSNGSAVFSINPVTLFHGQATVTVHDDRAENLILSAQALGGGALSHSGAITVSPEVPAGAITFVSVVPDSITANGASLSAITSQSVRDAYGNVVAPLTLIRVTPSLGTVASDDQDPSTPLTFERQTAVNGAVSVFIRSGTSPGSSTVAFQSVTGSASGNATVHFMPPPACTYAGYLTPRYLVPTHTASFRCSVTNGSPTGLNLTTASSISFADSSAHMFEAHLAAPAFLKGSSTDTLDFETAIVPGGMLGDSYTPRVKLVGSDRYGASYQVEFSAGSNSVAVSSIEIVSVTSSKSIVSRGDTFEVVVRVKNGGGGVVSVSDIVPAYKHGYYGVPGAWNPSLPNDLSAGVEREYRGNMRVFTNSPLGADTIDASVTAQVNGSQVQDASAYPNVAPIVVQSAASVAYVPGTLSPPIVSKGQSHSFSLSLRNDGEGAVILDGARTRLAFTDGAHPVEVALGSTGALPGNKVTGIAFPAAAIPLAMSTGGWPVTVFLAGTENGGSYADTLVLGDQVQVVDPAHIVYRAGTVDPTIVSKRSAVAFAVGVDNTGGARVECNPDSTWITFRNGSIVYLARLDGTRGRSVEPGLGINTLYFSSVTVPDAMPTGPYPATVRVMGTENGLAFSTSFVPSDQISVQNPSQLAILSTTVSPSDSVTADQTVPWMASIRVDNNGGATVRLDSLSVRLYTGSTEVTSQCVLTPQNFNPHIDMLSGGTGKTILVQFNDNVAGQMTAGTIVIESTVWGRDMNSGATLVATTEFGGKGSYLVQTPANLGFVAVVASVDTVTALQTKDWTVDVVLRNTGQSDILLDLGSSRSFLTFSAPTGFAAVDPTALRGGGLVLEGGSTDTLRYGIDRTGSSAGLCRIESTVRGTEINSGRVLTVASGTSGIHDDVLLQTAASLDIVSLTALQNPVTIAQARDWTIEMEVRNTGGSNATLLLARTDSTWVVIPGGTGFVIANPASLFGDGLTLHGGSSGVLDFTVQTTGSISAGMHVLTGAILASEDNSGRTLYATRGAAASTDSVSFELSPDPRYVTGSLTPARASSGASISFEATIATDALRRATLVLDPDRVRLSFGDADGDTFRTTLSPLSHHVLSRGGRDTLIFRTAPIDTAIAHVTLPVVLHLEGTENGNPFFANIAPLSDSVTVEKAPQLSIDRIVVPQSVTRSQGAAWPVRMILKNNGEASVVISRAPAKTFISFNIVGLGDRTYEYGISYPAHLEGSGSDTLAGGALDSLLFVVTTTGSTSGLALVNGRIEGIDINSALAVFDDTYSGGFSHMAIQTPGAPRVAEELSSRTTVTSGQTASWQIDLEVCNGGEAALTLMMDSTYVFYGGRLPLSHISPAGFVGGGLILDGGGCRHLLFDISPTPLIPAGADIVLHAHVGLRENNSAEYRYYDTRQSSAGFGAIRVQAPAQLKIVQVANRTSRSPYVNIGQWFPVLFEVTNEGEARADSVRIALEKSGSSTIADTIALVTTLNGGSSAADTFRVTAGGSSGPESFRAVIRGALDGNSRQGNLVSVSPAMDDTTSAVIQSLAALQITSVTPSQSEVNANQSVDWTVRVSIKNDGEAPLALGALGAADISFSRGGVVMTDYSAIPPDTLASGAHVLRVSGGGSDALIYRVVSTGSDTGMVAIDGLVPWHDMNDPGRAPETAGGSGSVHVKPPSGLRIISVTSDAPNNALLANTSIVDVAQVFNVMVRVENTGGDDLDSVTVDLASNVSSGGSTIVGGALAVIPSRSEKEFAFSVTAAPAPGTEILSSSITYAVSENTHQRVIPAQAVESVENLRIELPALLSCGASVTAPAGARDDTLSTGQSFVVTTLVTNEGQAVIDTLGEVTLVLPSSMHLGSAEPLVKRFTSGRAVSWTVVAPTSPSQDDVRAIISRIPDDVNRAAPAAVHTGEARLALRTELAARLSGCAVSITVPQGAVDGTLSTEQDFVVRSVFTPSANADSVWVELTVPTGFVVNGDRTRLIGRGTGTPRTIDWPVKAPMTHVVADTLVTRAGGKDMNSLLTIQTCRAVFPVHVQEKPALSLSAGISGPDEALDGVVSTDMPFTVTASIVKTGEAPVDTTGARIELVLPVGQGYALEGAGEHYRKAFSPGQPVVWNVRAPGSPTSPSNIEVKFAEPYATDVNTNAACTITAGDAFIPVQTEAGSVLMSNISRLDSIPPYVVPQGARSVPIMRIVFRNNSGYTIGLDTVFVALKDGRGRRIANPSRSIASIALAAPGGSVTATVASENPIAIVVAHGIEVLPGTSDTLLMRADVAAHAPTGEMRLEIEHSEEVAMSIMLPGGGSGAKVGASLEGTGGDIAGHFLSGPLSVMSGSFEEYVHNYPNPFRAGAEPTKICYFLKQDANVAIKIYDLGGSLVRTMHMGAGSAGGAGAPEGTLHEVPWDGRNDRGELVRNGVYLCKVEAGSQSALIKIAVAK